MESRCMRSTVKPLLLVASVNENTSITAKVESKGFNLKAAAMTLTV